MVNEPGRSAFEALSNHPVLGEKYEFVRKLGEGAFGIVFHCRKKGSSTEPFTECALKCIYLTDDIRSLQNEVKHALNLRHFNIVRYDEHFSIEAIDVWSRNYLCLEMEYCDGGSLKEAIESDHLAERIFVLPTLLHDMLLGLSFLHSNNLIHRDIKPANIVLTSKYHAKLADLGLVTSSILRTHTLTAGQGTPLYMAPEAHYDDYTDAVDICSLGIVFLEIFYSLHPKRAQLRMAELKKFSMNLHQKNGLDRNKFFPKDLQSCIGEKAYKEAKLLTLQMTEYDYGKRPNAAQLLNEECFVNLVNGLLPKIFAHVKNCDDNDAEQCGDHLFTLSQNNNFVRQIWNLYRAHVLNKHSHKLKKQLAKAAISALDALIKQADVYEIEELLEYLRGHHQEFENDIGFEWLYTEIDYLVSVAKTAFSRFSPNHPERIRVIMKHVLELGTDFDQRSHLSTLCQEIQEQSNVQNAWSAYEQENSLQQSALVKKNLRRCLVTLTKNSLQMREFGEALKYCLEMTSIPEAHFYNESESALVLKVAQPLSHVCSKDEMAHLEKGDIIYHSEVAIQALQNLIDSDGAVAKVKLIEKQWEHAKIRFGLTSQDEAASSLANSYSRITLNTMRKDGRINPRLVKQLNGVMERLGSTSRDSEVVQKLHRDIVERNKRSQPSEERKPLQDVFPISYL